MHKVLQGGVKNWNVKVTAALRNIHILSLTSVLMEELYLILHIHSGGRPKT